MRRRDVGRLALALFSVWHTAQALTPIRDLVRRCRAARRSLNDACTRDRRNRLDQQTGGRFGTRVLYEERRP